MKVTGLTVLILLVLAAAALCSGQPPTLMFDVSEVRFYADERRLEYADYQSIAIGTGFTVASRAFLVELRDGDRVESIRWSCTGQSAIGSTGAGFSFEDRPTADYSRYEQIKTAHDFNGPFGSQPVYIDDVVVLGNRRYARLIIFPVTIQPTAELLLSSSLAIYVGDRLVSADELLPLSVTAHQTEKRAAGSSLAESPTYVIITNETLRPAFERLAQYRTEVGHNVEIALVGEITASYEGRDDAEKIRRYLVDFYAAGGQYALLGGDETVVPIRYAYHYRTSDAVTVAELQICDLYYADLTGEWDLDNDGVWGERYDDETDLTAELYVGRLPLRDTADVRRYVNKLLAYETAGGGLDHDYVTRAFFFSSDEMRDYSNGGQHGRIAAAYPGWFEIDTIAGVEQSTGDDPSPSNMTPSELQQVLSSGYGIVNIVSHGRFDAFVLKSAYYNDWPKTYMLATESAGHGYLDSVCAATPPALYFSLACDNGAFDVQNLYGYDSPSLSRSLLGGSEGGAVAFVAHSRWGWVGTSHILQKAFFDSLFAHPGRPAIASLQEVKDQYYYYRDLVLGQNFYGDPALVVYTDAPRVVDVSLGVSGGDLCLRLTDETTRVADCRVVLSARGRVVADCRSNASGEVILGELDPQTEYTASAFAAGYTVSQFSFVPSMVTGVDDDPDMLPNDFALQQNYPNPFNPSTSISFDIPSRSEVTLDVFNTLGQLVATLVAAEYAPGTYTVEWNGNDESGSAVASGVYLYRLTANGLVDVKKMVLLR